MSRISRLSRRPIALSALIVPGLALALAGCDKVKVPGPARLDPLAGNMPRVQPLEGIGNGVYFEQPTVNGPDDGKPLEVSVPIRSVVDKYALNVQYRYQFLDRRGQPVENTGWKFKVLPPRGQEFLTGNALDTNATDWRLQIRPAR